MDILFKITSTRHFLYRTIALFVLAIICSCESDNIEPEYVLIETGEKSTIQQSEIINLSKTDILATSGDNILRLTDKDSLLMSNDLGKTWKSLENTIGIISFVHWFSDQSCLICGRYKAYWVDKSFSALHESTVYDYDGTKIDDKSPHFYFTLHGHKYYDTIEGKEVLIWPDYFGEVNNYISRVWATEDFGRTIKCICKNNETKTQEGKLISCRHFHDCDIREGTNEIYITSGDSGNQCKVIKGIFSGGKWYFSILAEGKFFKFGYISVENNTCYFITDYTGFGQTGVLKVDINKIDKIENYEYTFMDPDNLPLTKIYKFNNYSILTHDGSVKSKILMSLGGSPYKSLKVLFEGIEGTISYLSEQNSTGTVLLRKGNGYNITDLKLNDCMYDFTTAMIQAGYIDFPNQKNSSKMLFN